MNPSASAIVKAQPETLTISTAPPPNLGEADALFTEYLASDLVLETDDDLALASGIINDIAAHLDALEAARLAVSQPINQGLERWNSLFRSRRKKGEDARRHWDDKVRDLLAAREVARRAAETALQQAIVANDAPAATTAIQALQPAPRAAGLAVVDGWDFEETDHAQVPPAFTVVDRSAVMAEIRRQTAAGVAEPTVAGLRVFKRQIVKRTG